MIRQNERENNILSIAEQLLSADIELDEAIIDSQFFYRFDLSLYYAISEIRRCIWSLMEQDCDKPLTSDNQTHLKWMLHIERNRGISVGWDSSDGLTVFNTITGENGFSPFNKEWTKELLGVHDNEEMRERIWAKIWGEANQISKIHDRITRLGWATGGIPMNSELDDYSPNQIKGFTRKFFDWIMWGQIAPVFRWDMTQLVESKKEGIVRIIRPFKLPSGHWEDSEDGGRVFVQKKPETTKRMTPTVRIRTWAIYYLTRRGGGIRTESLAVDLWNETYPVAVTVNHFRQERTRLLGSGSKKTAPNDSLYMGLSWFRSVC